MAQWLVAQIIPKQHQYVTECVARMGMDSHYPRWRRRYGRRFDVVEERDLYPGYMFILSPVLWYRILERCSAVVGIAANADREPLRSLALDAHVEHLRRSVDSDGFLPPPRVQRRTRFLRGDRVHVQNKFFTGDATFLKLRSDGGAEVVSVEGSVPFVVREHEVLAA